jgi:hypothetical protein
MKDDFIASTGEMGREDLRSAFSLSLVTPAPQISRLTISQRKVAEKMSKTFFSARPTNTRSGFCRKHFSP